MYFSFVNKNTFLSTYYSRILIPRLVKIKILGSQIFKTRSGDTFIDSIGTISLNKTTSNSKLRRVSMYSFASVL
jgi:hypothetical protein